jgi:hypothetical protein
MVLEFSAANIRIGLIGLISDTFLAGNCFMYLNSDTFLARACKDQYSKPIPKRFPGFCFPEEN